MQNRFNKQLPCHTFVKLGIQSVSVFTSSHSRVTDTQKDYFCLGTRIWIWKCPDNLFGQISSIKGYKCKYYGVSCKNLVKLAFI